MRSNVRPKNSISKPISWVFSASIQVLAIAATDSTGYLPAAVSADNITASVPSRTAFATSDTSALVGTGDVIIDSIICVAVIVSLFLLLAILINFFWMAGTCASPTSTAKSPRATITPSEASRTSSIAWTASARSTLAIKSALPPLVRSNSRAIYISAPLFGHETAT